MSAAALSVRHIAALAVFVAACVVVGFLLGIEGEAVRSYVLLCLFLVLPLSAAFYAYLVSWWDSRLPRRISSDETEAEGVRSALPDGVEWIFPPHRPGRCNSPETSPDDLVVD